MCRGCGWPWGRWSYSDVWWLCRRRRLWWWRHTPQEPAGPPGGQGDQQTTPTNSATFLLHGAQHHLLGRHGNTLTYVNQRLLSVASPAVSLHVPGHTGQKVRGARHQLPAKEGHSGHTHCHTHHVPHQDVPHLQPHQSHDLHLGDIGPHPLRGIHFTYQHNRIFPVSSQSQSAGHNKLRDSRERDTCLSATVGAQMY